MEINRLNIANLCARIYKQQQGKDKPGTATSSPCSFFKKDCVKISSLSEVLKKEMARLGEKDQARAEKISSLSRQIEAGEYKIDPSELAAIILGNPEEDWDR
ncbi:MAG: flagellar biosynthesis anti-sigma factor FlgM [Dethiobacteria bacterium]|jgi:anti-sigma28 factor (negative regulator of flagellin synthesis)